MSNQEDLRGVEADGPALAAMMSRQAETLWERLDRANRGASALDRPEMVSKGLAVWARVYAGGDQSALLERLSWDGIDPGEAAAALGAVGEEPDIAPWIEMLGDYSRRAAGIERPEEAPPASLPFGELWQVWLAVGIAGLPEPVAEAFAGLSKEARSDLESLLLGEISRISESAVYEIFNSCRESVESPVTGLYESFVESCLADPTGAIYRHFPVLARQSVVRVEQWREMIGELLGRLDSDREELAGVFNGGDDPGALAAVHSRLADRHGGGRQVLIVELESGLRLAYKPRSVEPERFFAEVVAWCREGGLDSVPPVARVLSRDGYGWVEFISHERLGSEREAATYFRRAGSLVALAHALRARDLHAENIVATVEGPVLVDCELLLQPLRKRFSSGERLGELETAAGSCLATGLLTHFQADGGEDRGLAGLRGWPERSAAGSIWSAINADEMRLEQGEKRVEAGQNTVWIGDRFVEPADYASDLQVGFEAAYRFLMARRSELRSELLSRFERLDVRVLLRASQEYGRVLQLSSLPRNQRSGLVGSWMHEAMLSLFGDWDDRPALWPLTRDERTSLEQGDIPTFWLRANETSLRAQGGEEVDGLFTASGLDAVSRLLDGMSDEDLAFQASQLDESLVAWRPSGPLARALSENRTREQEGLAETSRRLAVAIGEQLLEAVERGALDDTGWTLAEGRPGPALLFAALAEAEEDSTRRRRWIGGATQLLGGAEGWVGDRPRGVDDLPIGGLHGLGSTVWGLVWLGRLLGDSRWTDAADALIGDFTDARVAADDAYDLTFGAAGAVMGLLAHAEVDRSGAALAAARRCGHHLLERQEVLSSSGAAWRNPGGIVQTGFAHGCAGIARALGALGEITGDSVFQVSATAALNHERGLFSAKMGNWPVLLQDMDGRRRRQWMVAFCRGAPGVALSRMLLPQRMQDLTAVAERELALDTASESPVGLIDMLCCGTLGRSWILLTAAERTGTAKRREKAMELAEGVVGRALERGFFTVSNDVLENREGAPGFLKGLSGIGLQFLRFGGETRLPDVLALELDSERRERCNTEEIDSASSSRG